MPRTEIEGDGKTATMARCCMTSEMNMMTSSSGLGAMASKLVRSAKYEYLGRPTTALPRPIFRAVAPIEAVK